MRLDILGVEHEGKSYVRVAQVAGASTLARVALGLPLYSPR